jgi:putative transposase
MSKWPHAPSHEVDHPGAYIVTASTQYKQKLFDTAEKLTLLEEALLGTLTERGWQIQAWAVFPNHYHFVGLSPDEGLGLTEFTRELPGDTAKAINRIDGRSGRTVWYRAWDTRISFPRSYMARLAYVHNNPVKHGIVKNATDYRWCSAEWFSLRADRPFYETIMSFKTDQVNVIDDF